MDSRIGLDYIVENRDYIAKLGAALDTQNATVKKQVFELLSALCAYSPDGYARAIETLEFYKNLKKQRYRFKIVINELELSSAAAHPPLDYQAALLAFINCVIISAATLQERIRIRNEFIGLKVLPLLNNLRLLEAGNVESSASPSPPPSLSSESASSASSVSGFASTSVTPSPSPLHLQRRLTFCGSLSRYSCAALQLVQNLKIRRIARQIEQPATDVDIKEQMADFLQAAESELSVLQAGMKQVESMRLKMSEFFCDDAATFRLEECFKIFHNFCDKFKQAVKENERRQQQEQQATLRRKQREEQLARRARQIGQAGTPVSDSEHSFLGDALFDPRASPALSRRHLGSGELSNGFIRLEQDGASPDITPNGSLRRRRSRVLAEEDDLMEFLRSSTGPHHDGHNSRERKAAYGSLDRSWARRARSGSSSRKRPDLLNIDFGLDRERASSPAPLHQQQQQNVQERLQSPLASAAGTPTTAANTPTGSGSAIAQTQSNNEDAKPRISREWRQKIETWLQSNESDEKQNEEYRRKRRLVNANRRSLENETENERKLDPLPEEKILPSTTTATPTNTPTTTNPTNSTNRMDQESGKYQRVYADWKPSRTLEQTDVVANLQAIADAQPHDALRQYRRQRSQEQSSPIALQSIAEEDRRKSLIQKQSERDKSNERLQIYIRRSSSRELQPAKPEEHPLPPKSPKPQVSDDTFASLLSHHKTQNEMQGSSKDVDADNIETPPVSRRVIATPTTTVVTVSMTDKPKAATEEKINPAEQDAPGHFDRHALARRTRRYKRPTDYSSGNEEALTTSSAEAKTSPSKPEPPAPEKSKQKERTINKLEKVGRHISSINQEDVREAIRNLKSPTGTPERPWSPPREITPSKLKLSASGHHELNDEGFEETQSLVSDTPSHGKGESTNSSCNEGVSETPARHRPMQKQKPTTTSITQMGRSTASKSQNQIPATQTATVKRSLSASRPLRMPNGQPLASAAPLRSASAVRRSPQEQQVLAGVERSSSRNSLRSSRSSINSGASTQTVVRRLPAVQRAGATVSVDSSPSKRPLAAQNLRPSQGRGVPASRSSSSGSSVGPSVILVRSKMSNTAPKSSIHGSTSFKENQSQSQPQSQSRMSAARSVVLVKNALNQQQQARMSANPSPQQRSTSSSRSVSSFMRPTASSATKRQK
ncbi:GD13991 [Drosophila simulans]|uniref:GD13991 n=1 Tax=Drosophila simulans TaxID=7240 RepID=B4QJX4_DROSI|nr:GD13991 [Drosophila simulans]